MGSNRAEVEEQVERASLPLILFETLEAQRDRTFLWAPVCFALGIGLYFALPAEPARGALWTLGAVAIGLVWAAFKGPRLVAPLVVLLALVVAGILGGALRTQWVAGPVLDWRYYGAVEGRVVALDRSQSGALRMTLDQVHLERVAPAKTPRRVRISLHGAAPAAAIEIGQRVMTTAHLSPPNGPVEPYGFDFRRHAWFLQIGAFGYTRNAVLLWEDAAPQGLALRINAIRQAISTEVLSQMQGREGAFAMAVTTGDRSAMDAQTLQNLRRSNLAHLLAISGLHMGLLTGVVFGAVRAGLALAPAVSMRVRPKKIAAVVALGAGAFYLGLSGGSVATERAFIMVSVMLGAVLVDRRALSLRAVALAALIVLCLRPEALVGPGFQMSFAATAALVWAFGLLRDLQLPLPRWANPILSVVVSSAVAGAATAPIAAIHFNQIVHLGLFANVIAVPVMGMVVVPGAVIAAVLWPVGLSWIGFEVMALGCTWILTVADFFGTMDQAVSGVPMPPPAVLPLIAVGGVIFLLWRGVGKWVGPAVGLVALTVWGSGQRPDVLIAGSGGLIGVMTDQGRVISRARGNGFVADNWLENDGALKVSQEQAAAGWARMTNTPFVQIAGKRQVNALNSCEPPLIFIANVQPEEAVLCGMWTPETLAQTGAVALRFSQDGWQMMTAQDVAGNRPWSRVPAGYDDLVGQMRGQVKALPTQSVGDQYVRINPTSRP
ncbi:ComEC/Rec2 family competence protein [Nereida sp. MMG025]|uniref:ComEC/Rec2 family competence protein n=1 Tax=Nereida sp. MMG025 TaxID=2909981 RepID=UPI00351D7359|nr:ComEC family competence protein [Nereida sp. MMG025]